MSANSSNRKPTYTKQVNKDLSISVSYLRNTNDEVECLLGFQNTLKSANLFVNPSQTTTVSNGWFSGLWGSAQPEQEPLSQEPESSDITVLLGYLQLFGHVTLNYKFDVGATASADPSAKTASWWANKEYILQYGDLDDNDGEDGREHKLEQTEFLQKHSGKNRLLVGGKLGGVDDLVVGPEAVVDARNKYLIQDLLYTFDSLEGPGEGTLAEDGPSLPVKDLTDAIVPFYTTSQYLLFTDLSIPCGETKHFRVRFNGVGDAPPLYNSRLTGIVGDQGCVSIRYLLAVGFLEASTSPLRPHTVYFPFEVKAQRHGTDERWIQPRYLDDVVVQKDWKVDTLEEFKRALQPQETVLKTKEAFLKDLNQLIDSDLHKVSNRERRKSSQSVYIVGNNTQPLEDRRWVPQLPSHMKTQYQIRVNNSDLCNITVLKPYYHVGDDISYSVEVSPREVQSTRVLGVIVHLEAHELFHVPSGDYTNVYKVSSLLKTNVFGLAIVNSGLLEPQLAVANGCLSVPGHVTGQFQTFTFLDLRYYLVFKFNLSDFTENGNEGGQNGAETDIFAHARHFRTDTTGTEFTFRLPVYLLP